jgi:hypothetical protein
VEYGGKRKNLNVLWQADKCVYCTAGGEVWAAIGAVANKTNVLLDGGRVAIQDRPTTSGGDI